MRDVFSSKNPLNLILKKKELSFMNSSSFEMHVTSDMRYLASVFFQQIY